MSYWPRDAVNPRPPPVDMEKILRETAEKYPNGILARPKLHLLTPEELLAKTYIPENVIPITSRKTRGPGRPWARKLIRLFEHRRVS